MTTCAVEKCRRKAGGNIYAGTKEKPLYFPVCKDHAAALAETKPEKPLDWWGSWAWGEDLSELLKNLMERDNGLPDPWLGRVILHVAAAQREALDYFIQSATKDQQKEEST